METLIARTFIAAGLIGWSAIPLAAQGAADAGDPGPDSALFAESFDLAWSRIHRTFFDTTFNGHDWTAVRDSLRPRAVQALSRGAFREVIRQMVGMLGQSHFVLIPRETADDLDTGDDDDDDGDAWVGLEVRREATATGGRAVVTRVEPGGPAAAAGVEPGWILLAIKDRYLAELDERITAVGASRGFRPETFLPIAVRTGLNGAEGSRITLRFLDAAGDSVTLDLERVPLEGQVVKFGNLPPIPVQFTDEAVRTPAGNRAGLIRFNAWMPPVVLPFARAVDAYRDADGLIIDLRGNGGGVAGLIMGMGGHVLAVRDTLGTMRTRDNRVHFIVNPQRVSPAGQRVEPFGGPVAVLTDALSMSTSEFFAGGLQAVGRVRVFGTRSAGQALPALMERLPNGDVLMYAIADYTAPGNRRLEGEGVIPDHPVAPTRAALLRGRDPVLEAALTWIDTMTQENP